MATAMTSLFAKELEELEAHEREMEEAADAIRNNVVIFWRHLSEIYDSKCWKAKYENFDAYCDQRWRFTGARGRQLVAAYEVAKNLASMTEDAQLGTFLFEYFTESHARVLKELPPEGQRIAWTAATASGEPPTAKDLSAAVETIQKSPDDVYAMGKDEQHAFISELEGKVESEATERRIVEILSLAQKRIRAVAQDMRDEKFGDRFREGDYHVTGGIVGLMTITQAELVKMHERFTDSGAS